MCVSVLKCWSVSRIFKWVLWQSQVFKVEMQSYSLLIMAVVALNRLSWLIEYVKGLQGLDCDIDILCICAKWQDQKWRWVAFGQEFSSHVSLLFAHMNAWCVSCLGSVKPPPHITYAFLLHLQLLSCIATCSDDWPISTDTSSLSSQLKQECTNACMHCLRKERETKHIVCGERRMP